MVVLGKKKLEDYTFIRSTFKDIEHEIQPGDLLLWSSRTLVSWIIRKWTDSDFSHASIALVLDNPEDGKRIVFTTEALAEGVVVSPLEARIKRYGGKCYWVPLADIPPEEERKFTRRALIMLGTDYDFGSLFSFLVGKVSMNARKFFCSEYARFIWQGTKTLGQEAPTPADLLTYDGLSNRIVEIS